MKSKIKTVLLLNTFLATLLFILLTSCTSSDDSSKKVSKKVHKEEGDYLILIYSCGQSTPRTNSSIDNDLVLCLDDIKQGLNSISDNKVEYGTITVLSLYANSSTIELEEINEGGSVKYTKDWLYYSSGILKGRPINTGNGSTLEAFLSFSKAHYDYTNTVLILANHGAGPYFETLCYEEDYKRAASRSLCITKDYPENNTYGLTAADIKRALNKTGYTEEKKPALLIEDCCLQSSIEILHDLRGVAAYYLSSSNLSYNHNYKEFIKLFKKDSSILDIGCNIVDEYIESMKTGYGNSGIEGVTLVYNYSQTSGAFFFTQSFIDLGSAAAVTALKSIKDKVSSLASYILESNSTTKSAVKAILSKSYNATNTSGDFTLCYTASYTYLNDLPRFCYELINNEEVNTKENESLIQEAANIIALLKEVIIYSRAYHGENLPYEINSLGKLSYLKASKSSYTYDKRVGEGGSNLFGITLSSSYYTEDIGSLWWGYNGNEYYNLMSDFGEGNLWQDLLIIFFPLGQRLKR